MKTKKYAISRITNGVFGIEAGQKFEIIRRYWYNGEGVYDLIDEDGETHVGMPDVFFNEED